MSSGVLLQAFLRFTDLSLRSQHPQMVPALMEMGKCPVPSLVLLCRSRRCSVPPAC